MKYSKRAGKEVPVYRIVWWSKAHEIFLDPSIDYVLLGMSNLIAVCYRVK